MTLYELYDIAENNNIDVDYFPMRKAVSLSIENAIAIDVDKLNSSADEKACLAHELGHCLQGAFYNINTLETRGRMEYKADKWAITHLLPYPEFQTALTNGITTPWELAEYFNLPESFIKKAFDYYQRRDCF